MATFPQDVTSYTLSIDGQIATASAFCGMQKERFSAWIGGVNAHNDLSVNDYLIWDFVQRAKSEGFKKLDLGELSYSRYKAKFNPVLEPFCYVSRTDALGRLVNNAYSKVAGTRLRAEHALRWRAKRESDSSREQPTNAEAPV
jgi:CelD/BcsL family acetyltransferase involved in cellulose biosynthesis